MVKENYDKYCGKFSEAVRETFNYLFDEYSFTPIFQDEGRGGEFCVLILGTPDCRIRFGFDRGLVNIVLGSRDAHIGWSLNPQDGTEEKGFWMGYYSARYYFQGLEYPRHEIIKQEIDGEKYSGDAKERLSKRLMKSSKELKPLMPDVIEFFQGKSKKYTFEGYQEFHKTVMKKINQHIKGQFPNYKYDE